MTVATKLGLYALGLAIAFAVSLGAGGVVGPIGTGGASDDHESPGHDEPTADGTSDVKGLAISASGYTLDLDTPSLSAGERSSFRFHVVGPDGRPVRAFRPQHERELHLIVANRDLTYFDHVHPTLDPAGTWRIPLTLPAPGVYRAFADFAVDGGPALTLGADVTVDGEHRSAPLPEPAHTARAGEYEITIDGAPRRAGTADVRFTVTKHGAPVRDLQPYLGAFGHLVVLRAGDLAYLHVHPTEEAHDGDRGGPAVRFGVELPSGGDYRFFLDFRHDGEVRRAAFTVGVPNGRADAHDDGER